MKSRDRSMMLHIYVEKTEEKTEERIPSHDSWKRNDSEKLM